MVREKSLVFIKPGHIDLADEIFAHLEKGLGGGFENLFEQLRIVNLPRALIEEHYEHIRHVPAFQDTINAFLKGGVVLTIYSGEGVIERVRGIIGVTCPKKSQARNNPRKVRERPYGTSDCDSNLS